MQPRKYPILFISFRILLHSVAAKVKFGSDGCLLANLVDINSKCDVQFVDDGNKYELNPFHCHMKNDLLLPTTIISNYRVQSNYTGINIHTGRIAKCKLIMIFLIPLQIVITQFVRVPAQREWLSEYFITSSEPGNIKWTRLKQAFILFIADSSVQTMAPYSPEEVLVHYFYIQLISDYLDFIAIAYLNYTNLLELCFYPFGLGLMPKYSPEEIICVHNASNDENVRSLFENCFAAKILACL